MNFSKSFELSNEMKNLFPTRKEKRQTRNFLVENIRSLRDMQLQMDTARKAVQHNSKDIHKQNKRSPFTTTKPINPWARYTPTENVEPVTTKMETTKKYLTRTSRFTQVDSKLFAVSRSVQTSPSRINDRDDMVECQKVMKSTSDLKKRLVTNSQIETNKEKPIKNIKGAGINFVELNRRAEYKPKIFSKEKINHNSVPVNYHLGELPRYLKVRKRGDASEERRDLKDQKRGDASEVQASIESFELEACGDPEVVSSTAENGTKGHILLSEEERIEHLRMIKKSYDQLLKEYNQLPLRNDSLKARQKRIELENRLDNLEKSMKIFSKDKLFIKI